MTVPTDPSEPLQRHITIVSIVLAIAASLVSIAQGAGSRSILIVILAACAVGWLVLSGQGRKTLTVGRFRPSWNLVGAVLLLTTVAAVLAASWQPKQEVSVPRFEVDKTAPRPAIVDSAEACVADLKRQYSCSAFRELVARSPSILMSNDPRHMTLDDPLELAVAIGQGKMLLEGAGGSGDYCALYEQSVSEACNTLAGAEAAGLR